MYIALSYIFKLDYETYLILLLREIQTILTTFLIPKIEEILIVTMLVVFRDFCMKK